MGTEVEEVMTKRKSSSGLRNGGRYAGPGIDYDRYGDEDKEWKPASPRRLGCRLPSDNIRDGEKLSGEVITYNINDPKKDEHS